MVSDLNCLKKCASLIQLQGISIVGVALQHPIHGLCVVLAADVDELVRRVPFRLVEIEWIFLRHMVSLHKSLVVQSSQFVVRCGGFAIQALGISLVSVGNGYVKQLPLTCEEEFWEVAYCCYVSFMQPHHILDVVTGVVASGCGVLEVV